MRSPFAGLMVAAGFVLAQSVPAQQPPVVDPKALVGEWQGDWGSPADPRSPAYLTVRSVDGQTVSGEVHLKRPGSAPASYFNRDITFAARLEGNTLAFRGGREQVPFTLTVVDERHIVGTVIGIVRPFDVDLRRK